MTTNRRSFFRKLFGGGGACVMALSALDAIAPEAQATEIREGRKYLIKLRGFVPVEELDSFEHWLRQKGIDAVLVDESVQEIFAIDKSADRT